MTPTAVALAQVMDLVELAAQSSAAAQRISALIAQRHARGEEITDEDWMALVNDRQMAQTMLVASIAKRRAAEG